MVVVRESEEKLTTMMEPILLQQLDFNGKEVIMLIRMNYRMKRRWIGRFMC